MSSSRFPFVSGTSFQQKARVRKPTLIHTHSHRGEDRAGGGIDPGEFNDRRRVVDDRVDAGHLLQDRQSDPDHQRRFDHGLPQLAPAAGLLVKALLISSSSRSIVSGSSTRILASVARAAKSSPLIINQRGLCGIRSMPNESGDADHRTAAVAVGGRTGEGGARHPTRRSSRGRPCRFPRTLRDRPPPTPRRGPNAELSLILRLGKTGPAEASRTPS